MAMGSAQPLTEMSTTNLPGGRGRPECKVDNLTAISEMIVHKLWEPQSLTTLWASMACYRDSFTFSPPPPYVYSSQDLSLGLFRRRLTWAVEMMALSKVWINKLLVILVLPSIPLSM
jgi:hypothetical protein